MSDDTYPILIERFGKGGESLHVGCNTCGKWWEEKDPDAAIANVDSGHCPHCESWNTYWRFEEASRCPGCGTLSLELDPRGALGGACSRKCQLQVEYAASLRSA
jgi:hypothetical protein